MKDRVPTYAGRVKLTPVSNQPNTYDMERADVPIETGTPLNTKTLLDNSVSDRLGLGEDATPSDAFSKILDKLGGAGDSPVYSVNGRTGAVELSASDVGAAPSGYGLGTTLGKECSNCNDAVENGWYRLSGSNCQNYPTAIPSGGYGALFVEVGVCGVTDISVYQRVTMNGYSARRYGNSVTNVWQPWEYENPPMTAGVEYRTTERYNGKVVYTKLVDCGETGTSNKYVDTGLNAGVYDIIGYEGFIRCWSLIASRRANVEIHNTDPLGETGRHHICVKDTYSLVPDTCKVLIKYVEI